MAALARDEWSFRNELSRNWCCILISIQIPEVRNYFFI